MRKTINVATCDLCKKTIEYDKVGDMWALKDGEKIKPWKDLVLTAVFHTEQTEGTSCLPYFDTARVDICPECLEKLIEKWPLHAWGAQGYNKVEADI